MGSKEYDYIVVGSGLFGSVFAHEMHIRGKKCLVIEKRNHVGGNVHNTLNDGIITHEYGAHIFHTNSEKIWKYINQFSEFRPYIHQVKVNINHQLYSFPININTMMEWFHINDGDQALSYFLNQRKTQNQYSNLEEMGLGELGESLYENFIKSYTEKQWSKPCNTLPTQILSRLPIRFNYDENYFEDKYQGIPINGYNPIIEKLLYGIEVKINTNFFTHKKEWEEKANQIIYTGCLDQLFDYEFGKLEYRSLKFEHERVEKTYFQEHSVINYPSANKAYTRIIEHKHFHPINLKHTIITKEIPQNYTIDKEPYYPIVDEENKKRALKYTEKAKKSSYLLGGRLAEFKYYDMHQVIASALHLADQQL
jgi:UDP-galactopyranose mutase